MIGGKAQSSIVPVALGATLTSSTYGSTIPVLHGRTKQALYLIWNANLRTEHNSGKKVKKVLSFGIKKGPTYYCQNADFLLATNPIVGPLQLWVNQSTFLPLVFTQQNTTVAPGAAGTITIADAKFYSVIGVTLSASYSVTFDDYGGPGPVTLTGSYEIPLWNSALAGPNVTDMQGSRAFPYVYNWLPGYGAIIGIETCGQGLIGGTFNIYYAQLATAGSTLYSKTPSNPSSSAVPVSAVNLTFEPQLGDYAPTYSGFSAQQIIYPHYAGISSPAIDMGSAQVMPTFQLETQGSNGVYSTGDADFCDIVRDIFMGAGQSGLNGIQAYTEVQHGLGCFNYPGCVQKKMALSSTLGTSGGPSVNSCSYDLPNTAGDFLIAFVWGGDSSTAISDTAGNTWTPVFPVVTNQAYQIWVATALYAVAGNTVTLTGNQRALIILEVAGVDTWDATADGTVFASGSLPASFRAASVVTATNVKSTPEYLLSFNLLFSTSGGNAQGLFSFDPAPNTNWNNSVSVKGYSMSVQERTVYDPGNYPFFLQAVTPAQFEQEWPGGIPIGTDGTIVNCVLAFKGSQPPSYPKPLGDILDGPSLEQVRLQCRAAQIPATFGPGNVGLCGSLLMDSQQNASDYLTSLYKAMNAAPVWAGFKLLSIPYSEVSAVGNGAVYVAPTAAGPVAALTEADMIAEGSTPPVEVQRKAQVDIPNLLQIQFPNRAGQYNDVIISQPEAGAIALYGPRKDAPQQMRMIQDPAIARIILGIDIRRQNYLRNTYKFTLKAKWKMLLPMDLITIPVSSTMALPSPEDYR